MRDTVIIGPDRVRGSMNQGLEAPPETAMNTVLFAGRC